MMINKLVKLKTKEQLIEENSIIKLSNNNTNDYRINRVIELNSLYSELFGKHIYVSIDNSSDTAYYEDDQLSISYELIDIDDYINNYTKYNFGKHLDLIMLTNLYNLFVNINNAVYNKTGYNFIIPQRELLLVDGNRYSINNLIEYDDKKFLYRIYPNLEFYNGMLIKFNLIVNTAKTHFTKEDAVRIVHIHNEFESIFGEFLSKKNLNYNDNNIDNFVLI